MVPSDWTDEQIQEAIARGEVVDGSSHIGFIPKGTGLEEGVIYVTLDQGTIFENSKDAPDPGNFPNYAITQAYRHFLRGELRLMAATGPFKQRNIEKVLFQPPCLDNPASIVTLGETIIFLDIPAAERVMGRLKSENFIN